MPVTIGAKPESDFKNPIGMLSDCHRRIERFLAGLITITEDASSGELPQQHRQQFEGALRYFREAAPKHTLDEEESLFPRLLKHRSPLTEPILAVLDHLEAEHLKAEDRHLIVDRLGMEWLASGVLSPIDRDLLLTNLRKLQSDYEEHIAIEDHQIFPFAACLLSREELALVGEEMAARRGLQTLTLFTQRERKFQDAVNLDPSLS